MGTGSPRQGEVLTDVIYLQAVMSSSRVDIFFVNEHKISLIIRFKAKTFGYPNVWMACDFELCIVYKSC
jgi:hypothetical protein